MGGWVDGWMGGWVFQGMPSPKHMKFFKREFFDE
jgi:hypothetical protein